ncbi:MAG: type III PLP-dependent enzyme [Pseudomonadota bacterium]
MSTRLQGAAAPLFRSDVPAHGLARRWLPPCLSPRLAGFLADARFDRPTLVVDLDAVETAYGALARGLGAGAGGATIFYAVKANPHPAVLARLARLGASFDAASRGEIELCLAAGARADRISFGNTVKRASDIAFAHAAGVDLFAADAPAELAKIAEHAPGARVFLRLLVEESAADWPLGRKFGAGREEVVGLMLEAERLGLRAVGLSFHVGSQTARAELWRPVLDVAAGIWAEANAAGLAPSLVNIGGGFPALYHDAIEAAEPYGRTLMADIRARFGDAAVMAEPGRGLVGDAGVIEAEVLLVSKKRATDLARWVYLDIGKFSGLAETIDEAIRYRISTEADTRGGGTGPCVLAGPSCDSADVLYEKRPMALPLALRTGDRVWIHACGAYTSSYSSVGFNGFPPLDTICF